MQKYNILKNASEEMQLITIIQSLNVRVRISFHILLFLMSTFRALNKLVKKLHLWLVIISQIVRYILFFLFIFEEQKITYKATNDTRDEKRERQLGKKKKKKT